MKKKILLIGIPIALVIALVTAYAATGRGFHGHHREWARDFMFYKLDQIGKELNLDADQQAKLDSFKQDVSTLMEERQSKRQEIHKLVHDELKKDNPDIRTVQPLIDQQIDEMAQAAHQMVGKISDFYDQLKPEQKKQLNQILEDRFGHHDRTSE